MTELVDRWGMQTESYNQYAFLAGSGERIAIINNEGYPELQLDRERIVTELEKAIEIQNDKVHVLDAATPIWLANFIAVPITATDLERTGIVIEALSWESKYTLLPAYYDITLKTKASRDEESNSMLDLIFATTVYDIGAFFNWAEVHGMITSLKDAGTYASRLASIEQSINTQMEKTITAIEELEY